MKKSGIVIVVVLIILAAAALWYLNRPTSPEPSNSMYPANTNDANMEPTSSPSESAMPTESATPTESAMPSPGASAENVKSFTVSGKNFSFTPKTLTVKKGDTVKVTFKNIEGFHDFKIDEFNLATKQISGGAEETVQFTADKTGTFQYYCSVGQHRANGMWGTLTVQ